MEDKDSKFKRQRISFNFKLNLKDMDLMSVALFQDYVVLIISKFLKFLNDTEADFQTFNDVTIKI